jgi:hypothetical protein
MQKPFEVRWEGELPAAPQQVWDAITKHPGGYLWPIAYEPRVGGAERGLTRTGGTVTAWEEPRHFATATQDNELEYVLEPLGAISYLRYRHRTEVLAEEFDVQLAACRGHTTFYLHSLGQYACHFPGRQASYVSADTKVGFAAVRRALGVPEDAVAGDPVRLAPFGIEGVVDYATGPFLGIRSADALYRLYGRDAWCWPAGIAHHQFGVVHEWTEWAASLEVA